MAQYTIKKVFNFINFKDILNLIICVLVFPFAILAKIFIRDFWLVSEDENEARDNGYHFFKWVKENRPKQKIAYAINKKSVDYLKVKNLGKIISYGSISHWFWYIVADKNISSQKGGKPNAAVCYLFEVVLGFRKNNRVFLQHGITINKAEWLFYNNAKFRLFITATNDEHEYILNNFNYPTNNVKLCGFARFDNLIDNVVDDNLILVMPSWRNWLGRESKENKNQDFTESNYFKYWNSFLNSEKLDKLLKKHGKRILFYPHRNMQKFLSFFSTNSENVIIADWTKYDIQSLLKESKIMITDYSSVFFDFSYMKKAVLFYQFDEEEFRQKQYDKGYFDYKDTPLAKWSSNEEDLINNLDEILSTGCNFITDEQYHKIFPYHDKDNCYRIYTAIKEAK
ncbi:MAG: CDP-glycerol glycerophosphotransferase family protein [Clostridia bacterium]|nr:CDP-glycerol glycerophosphotransferase family protein [Clostridia bacterium]